MNKEKILKEIKEWGFYYLINALAATGGYFVVTG